MASPSTSGWSGGSSMSVVMSEWTVGSEEGVGLAQLRKSFAQVVYPAPPQPFHLALPPNERGRLGPHNVTLLLSDSDSVSGNAAALSAFSPPIRAALAAVATPPALGATRIDLRRLALHPATTRAVVHLAQGGAVAANLEEARFLLHTGDLLAAAGLRRLVDGLFVSLAPDFPLFCLSVATSFMPLSHDARMAIVAAVLPRVDIVPDMPCFAKLGAPAILALLRHPAAHGDGPRERRLFHAALRWLAANPEELPSAAALLDTVFFAAMDADERRQCWADAAASPLFLSGLLLPRLIAAASAAYDVRPSTSEALLYRLTHAN